MDLPLLSSDQLKQLAGATAPGNHPGCTCRPIQFAAWESVPEERWPKGLMKIGTLREADVAEPTFEEFHPAGTRYDSANAPIALGYFPFNRCDVHQCQTCRTLYLRYTEFGGYYVDHRVRMIEATLIV